MNDARPAVFRPIPLARYSRERLNSVVMDTGLRIRSRDRFVGSDIERNP